MKGHHLYSIYIHTHTSASALSSVITFQTLLFPLKTSHHTPQMEETKSKFKRICVYCGSSSGNKASYQEAAVELGEEMVILLPHS